MIETVSSIFYYIAAGIGAVMCGVAAIVAAGKHSAESSRSTKRNEDPDPDQTK